MSKLTTVTEGQTLLDICLQELGTVAAVFELADANNLGVTDTLTPGQQLVVPTALATRPEVVAYFTSRRQRINTSGLMLDVVAASKRKYFSPKYFSTKFFA